MNVILFGCGGHARSIVNTIRKNDEKSNILLVDKNATNGEVILNCKVECVYQLRENDSYIVAIGDNLKRKKIYEALLKFQMGHCISVVANNAIIGIETKIGKGTFIASNTYIGPEVKIGNNTIINTGSLIEHEVVIGDHTHIAPHVTICGRTRIGNNVFCGAGSTIIDKVAICDNVIIGAGAVVIDDITKTGVYVGVPAKKITGDKKIC